MRRVERTIDEFMFEQKDFTRQSTPGGPRAHAEAFRGRSREGVHQPREIPHRYFPHEAAPYVVPGRVRSGVPPAAGSLEPVNFRIRCHPSDGHSDARSCGVYESFRFCLVHRSPSW
jgi:hypothetical protein